MKFWDQNRLKTGSQWIPWRLKTGSLHENWNELWQPTVNQGCGKPPKLSQHIRVHSSCFSLPTAEALTKSAILAKGRISRFETLYGLICRPGKSMSLCWDLHIAVTVTQCSHPNILKSDSSTSAGAPRPRPHPLYPSYHGVEYMQLPTCPWCFFWGGCSVMLLMEEIRLTSWYGKYPTIYRVSYIPGGCLGFLPSTVGGWLNFWNMNLYCYWSRFSINSSWLGSPGPN